MLLASVDTASELITAGAAFLSGIGSVLTGYFALRWERKRGIEDCNNRLAALHEGIDIGHAIDHQ